MSVELSGKVVTPPPSASAPARVCVHVPVVAGEPVNEQSTVAVLNRMFLVSSIHIVSPHTSA